MKKNIALIGLVILLAVAIGFILGSNDNPDDAEAPAAVTETDRDVERTDDTQSTVDVKSLINYTLPNSWEEATCPSNSGAVYFTPGEVSEVDCSSNPDLQISLSVSNQNITECNQIQEVEEVKKHICKSLFINDLRSLVAETEYLASSTYGRETYVKTYYLDSGSGIVKAQYISANGSTYQASFDDLVNSITSK